MDKAGWRRWAADRRAVATVDGPAVVAHLARFLAGVGEGWVVTYRPLAHEVDVTALEADPALGPFALTRTPGEGHDLTLHPAASRTERHRWGFEQPVAGSPEVPPSEVAAVLVPGVAFDRAGHRLGHGLGHYDRLLARLRPDAVRIGVTPSSLVVDALPVEPHDVPMTHLVTELALTPCP